MQHARKHGQTADAFSLPAELLQKARARAAAMGMTKSGFYRYCLAKELGHDEATARAYAVHRAVLNTLESNSNVGKPGGDVSDQAADILRNHRKKKFGK